MVGDEMVVAITIDASNYGPDPGEVVLRVAGDGTESAMTRLSNFLTAPYWVQHVELAVLGTTVYAARLAAAGADSPKPNARIVLSTVP
jgi:hypothetical protein